uniref:DH domain-containing protein n=1 Tax=Pseudonaja textilis TaxID=8673 RepID=A0A670YCQ2_PSETE
ELQAGTRRETVRTPSLVVVGQGLGHPRWSGTERKESVLEFVNTEASYGEDLRIIKEEFYLPMQAAGLLTQEQLLVVFSNIQELIDLNENFLEYLQEEIEQAIEQVLCRTWNTHPVLVTAM